MRTLASLALPFLLVPFVTAHCGGSEDPVRSGPVADGGSSVDAQATQPPAPPLDPLPSGAKLDLLFVVDNSAAMGAKQAILAGSLTRIFGSLAAADVHVGVISSSIANGGDLCVTTGRPRRDDRAHLLNTTAAATPTVVAGAEAGFLSLGPGGTVPDVATLQQRTAEIINGVGETGCGIEAQLEAMYRFVAQPDPSTAIALDAFQQAEPTGIDYELLAQRKAFFRPDSTVAIIMLTDEEDGSIDPSAIGGFGYAFSARNFPGSNVPRGTSAQGKTAPRGTSTCATNPTSADCASCGFATTCDPSVAACQKIKNDPVCKESPIAGQTGQGFDGYYGPGDDDLNVRMHEMKRRYGVEPRYPLSRYLAALTGKKVPDRATEHPTTASASGQRIIADYVQGEKCSNPLFSTDLPQKSGDELCALKAGTRDPKKVVFGLLGGVPGALLAPTPDWTKILGKSPAALDTTGIDPHMLLSIEPRAGLTGADLPKGDNGTDTVHGREWRTEKRDLQYACTFPLPTAVKCEGDLTSCECFADVTTNAPVCGGAGNTTQLRGKAYPTARELALANALGDQAVVGSLCELDANGGYGSFLDAFAKKLVAIVK